MKALGKYKVNVPTGEFYKSGVKKGKEKYKKEWCEDGVKGTLDWAIQLNYYRILLEQQGLSVTKMVIQAMCRDNNLRIASERGIDQAIYLLPIHPIRDQWIQRYMRYKAKALQVALETRTLPSVCRAKERWNNRKCLDYCNVVGHCPYGNRLKVATEKPLQVVS